MISTLTHDMPMAAVGIIAMPACCSSALGNRFSRVSLFSPARRAQRNFVNRGGVLVKASPVVLVDKTEAEKTNRLRDNYWEKVVHLLKEEFSYTNIHQVPKLEKIVVNCMILDAAQDSKGLEAAMRDLSLITGQWPMKTKAKKSIAALRIKQGQTNGILVTLRKKKMYYFLDRFINLVLPRTRDFQGLNPNSFDGQGNYCLCLRDLRVFPEMKHSVVHENWRMDICIATTAISDVESQKLLSLLGMPFHEDVDGARHKKKRKQQYFMHRSRAQACTIRQS